MTEEVEIIWEIFEQPGDETAIAIRFDDGTPVVSINRVHVLDLALNRRALPKAIAQSIEQALTDYLQKQRYMGDMV